MGTRDDYFPSQWLKAADLGDVGTEQAVMIEYEASELIEDRETGRSDTKPTIKFAGFEKPLILNVTNWKVIAALHGEDSVSWPNKWVTLYVTTTEAFGEVHVVLRVRDTIPAPQAIPQAAPAAAALPE
jgi:hypothetical protein